MRPRPPLHVFFVNNPIVQLVSSLVVMDCALPDSDIYTVSVRNADCSLLGRTDYTLPSATSFLGRIFARLGLDLSVLSLSYKLRSIGRPFYIYTSWDYSQVKQLSLSPLFRGKYYVEEGQLAYMNDDVVSYYSRGRGSTAGKPLTFDEDHLGGFCISSDAFKWMNPSIKTVYSDLSAIQPRYKQKLQGIKNIGLLPQPHRIPQDKWIDAFKMLAKSVGQGGAIKLHPGFFAVPQWAGEVKRIMAMDFFSGIVFCDNTVVLEIEMIYEAKSFFGARTSIQRYAKQMGSEFNIVEFEGYIPSAIPESVF